MTRFISEIDRLEAENAILRQQLAAARGDTPEARVAWRDVTRRSDELLQDESFRAFVRQPAPTVRASAEGILAAMARATGEDNVVPLPTNPTAQRILAAYRKARRARRMIYDSGGARFMTVLRICGEPFAFMKVPTPECRRRLELGLSRYVREQEDIARRGSLTKQIAEANRRARGKE